MISFFYWIYFWITHYRSSYFNKQLMYLKLNTYVCVLSVVFCYLDILFINLLLSLPVKTMPVKVYFVTFSRIIANSRSIFRCVEYNDVNSSCEPSWFVGLDQSLSTQDLGSKISVNIIKLDKTKDASNIRSIHFWYWILDE